MNPRRALRAAARCRTAVVTPTASFEAETEDIGARGCQVASPKGVRKGEAARLTVANDRVREPLRVAGRIAWVSAHFPWRVGIAFDEAALPATTAWFERLVEAHPGLRAFGRLPERIPLDATIYLGPPPRFLVDFSADEAAILRAVGSGVRVDEIVARLRARGPAVERALFSLIARSAVTLARGQAVHPEGWKRILDQVEASFAVEALGTGPASLAAPPEPAADADAPTPAPAPAAVRAPTPAPVRSATPGSPPREPGPPALERAPARDPGLPPARAGAPPPAAEAATRGAGRALDAGAAWGVPPHAPDFTGKGVGWRKAVQARGLGAQAVFERAHEEFLAGNVNGAIALLRRALSLAPGDPEIAEVLGKLAFRGRGTQEP